MKTYVKMCDSYSIRQTVATGGGSHITWWSFLEGKWCKEFSLHTRTESRGSAMEAAWKAMEGADVEIIEVEIGATLGKRWVVKLEEVTERVGG